MTIMKELDMENGKWNTCKRWNERQARPPCDGLSEGRCEIGGQLAVACYVERILTGVAQAVMHKKRDGSESDLEELQSDQHHWIVLACCTLQGGTKGRRR